MVATRKNFPLLDELLAEQQKLDTPVARFARDHAAGSAAPGHRPLPTVLSSAEGDMGHSASGIGPTSHVPRHSSLIPLSRPGPGEQYAFEVDLDSCSGCKACVSACHSLNGLDDDETWRDVGVVVGGSVRHPYQQTVTTACHHCADPACLNGCPVLAYEKDPVTGIVRHLDDQCIGCQYCVLKCPYDVPKYNARLGIVRKCDLCHGRLAEGEAPACAQACPTHAIRIVTVSTAPGAPATDRPLVYPDFLRAAPDPAYTRPTTRYVTMREQPSNVRAADAQVLRPQPPHWPLAIMLTLLPIAVGCLTAASLPVSLPRPHVTYYVTFGPTSQQDVTFYVTLAGWLTGAAGLFASVFHLGQPLRAWRIFLGWRLSWLSREALVFGAWFAVAGGAILWSRLAPIAAVLGFAGLLCSAMVYADTHRRFWRFSQAAPRILGTAVVTALAIVAPRVAAGVLLLQLIWEWRTCFDHSPSARLQQGPLRMVSVCRDGFGLAAAALLLIRPGPLAFGVLFAGEFAGRHLFFRAVDAPKMPGVPA